MLILVFGCKTFLGQTSFERRHPNSCRISKSAHDLRSKRFQQGGRHKSTGPSHTPFQMRGSHPCLNHGLSEKRLLSACVLVLASQESGTGVSQAAEPGPGHPPVRMRFQSSACRLQNNACGFQADACGLLWFPRQHRWAPEHGLRASGQRLWVPEQRL